MRAVDLKTEELPEIPAKRYFAIGEVAELCEVKPHVLRYWEQEFPQLKPIKRRGNRRYYQQEDVLMVRKIRSLLYEQGFTITGARQQLRDAQRADDTGGVSPAVQGTHQRASEIQHLRDELESLLKLLPGD
ncbi:MerR family transcriptional regulator [Flagellatimonas centrodinii]|uniref:MerR family transcriptional regulator n=1 Tax=Flagellatimonas centrodinii TaxID=2806210 RepID=UPI00344C0BC7